MNNNEEFDVRYNTNSYNIYDFLNNHPGGTNYIRPYEEKDVTKPMSQYEHSKAAYYLLEEYRKGGRRIQDDGDLEKLVDWEKPMLGQVTSLGDKYYEWVTSPVDRRLRLFENPLLENLTITPWYVVPMIWIPVIFYVTLTGARILLQFTKDSSLTPVAFFYIIGVVLWSLVEYSLHRWVFHIVPTGKSKTMIYFHFIIHGLHHKVPFDTRRLVFPPFPAAIVCFVLYQMICLVFSETSRLLVLGGGITGYVTYDMIHFYLHYGLPAVDSYLYHLKRYHNQHHFAQHESGFGISSMIWDKIFGTTLKLRKLKMGIKW